MIKLMIDELTGKITGYSVVRDNLPVYKEDTVVDDSALNDKDLLSGKCFYEEGGIVIKEDAADEEEVELQNARRECEAKENANEAEVFVSALMEGKSIEEAREIIQTQREETERLKSKIKEISQRRERRREAYWIEKNRQLDDSISYQYYSAVVMVIKHENKYLKEWLDHHFTLGFEHIYLYDNGTEEKVTEIISAYPEDQQKKITVIDWSGSHKNIQQDAYNDFLENHKKDVRWGIFLDSDEFLRFENEVTVNDFLKGYEDYTEVYGYMISHTANGQEAYEDKPVRERFTETTDIDEGVYHKNFMQVNRIDSFIRHYADYDKSRHKMYRDENDNKNLFVIEHYYTKSWEEWKEKILKRGSVDPVYLRRLQEFFRYNPDMEYLNTGENPIQKYQNK